MHGMNRMRHQRSWFRNLHDGRYVRTGTARERSHIDRRSARVGRLRCSQRGGGSAALCFGACPTSSASASPSIQKDIH